MRTASFALCVLALSASAAAARDCYAPTPEETARYQAIAKRLAGEETSGALKSVSQQEVQWALQLEQRVMSQGYQPTEQEIATYTDIARRLQAVEAPAPPPPPPPPTARPSAKDLHWALALEARVKRGKNPTDDEFSRYRDIVQRLKASEAAGTAEAPASRRPAREPATPSEPVSEADLAWAIALQTRVQGGGEASEAEKVRYDDIYRRQQAATSPPAPTPPKPPQVYPQPYPPYAPPPQPTWNVFGANEADIQWALELERKVKGPCPAP